MAKLAVLAVLTSLFGVVSCEFSLSVSIFAIWGFPTPDSSQPSPPLPPAIPPPSPTPELKVNHYAGKCSVDVEKIVKDEVKKATAGVLAGLIRLFFHDCFVQGCDASVLLNQTSDGPKTERQGGPNLSLRGFEVIDKAKAALEAKCPGVVSCADILAFAGRDASNILSDGLIDYKVPAGRFDGNVSLADDTRGKNLPPPFADLNRLTAMFAAKGLNETDMVVLSGAHSIGRSHCSSFSDRVPPPPPANRTSTSMDADLGEQLDRTCSTGNSSTTVQQDYQTAYKLDVKYYQNVLSKKVLFNSDAVLALPQTKALVERYAAEGLLVRNEWYKLFGEAMKKMGNIGVKNITQGEIRKTCAFVN